MKIPLALLFCALVAGSAFVDRPTVRHVLDARESGPVYLIAAPPRQSAVLVDLLDQLALVPLTKGSLVLVEAPEAASLDEIVASAGRSPDVLLIHRFGTSQSEQSRDMTAAPSVLSNVPEEAAALLTSIVGESSFSVLPLAEPAPTRTFLFAHAPSVPLSRSIRRGRELALAMLRAEAMLGETEFSWERLAVEGSPLYNLYDAEGTGGAGPGALVRITEAQLPGARVVRVCGEDVRDGSLTAAIGLLVPGGSGRGIAEGLGEVGQHNVRSFVESGGGYVGICAGAYLATCRIDGYLRMVGLNHDQPWRRGGAQLDVTLTEEGRSILGAEFERFSTRYNNGPVFLNEDTAAAGDTFPPLTVLARFATPSVDNDGVTREEMVGTPAIAASPYGAGRVMMISPHPESHVELYPLVARAIRWSVKQD